MKFKAVGRKVTEENILCYLLDPTLPTVAEFTTKQLIKSSGDSNNVITPDEIWEFINTKYWRNTFRLPTKEAWKYMKLLSDTKNFNWWNKIATLKFLRQFVVLLL